LSDANYPKHVSQHAIWVLSNDHQINSVTNENEADFEKMQKLYKYLAKIKGIKYEFPWYTVTYKVDTARVFTNIPEKVIGKITYSLPHNSEVDIVVRSIDNQQVAVLASDMIQNPSTYDYRFTLDVSRFKKGKYILLVVANNQQILKKEFEI
jgi:hypothetical protein